MYFQKENILFLGEWLTQGLDNAAMTADTKYPVNSIESRKRFVLNLYYNSSNSFFVGWCSKNVLI